MRKTSLLIAFALALFALGFYTFCRKTTTGPSSPTTGAPATTPQLADRPVVDERLAAVIAELTEKWDRVQSVSAKVQTEIPNVAGLPGDTKGNGTYDLLKKDGKTLIRFSLANNIRYEKSEDTNIRTAEYLHFVHDGSALYFQSQQPKKMKKTTKSKYSPARVVQIGGAELFRSLTENFNLKLAPDETVDGIPTYVIEATLVGQKWKARHYFDKATGIRVRQVEFDEQGKDSFFLSLSEINLTPQFSEGHFTYNLPEGFELIDETAAQP